MSFQNMVFHHMLPLTKVLNLCLLSSVLLERLKYKLHFTFGYHPEGDRQTEHVNQTLEQYLQIYCNYQQDNLHSLLPIADSNTPSSTTRVSLFFANKSYNPAFTVHCEYKLVSVRGHP